MAKSKRAGKAHANGYARYKTGNVEASNRKKKLQRLAKGNPNNAQITKALDNIYHRRNVPKTPFWSSSMIRVAKIVKAFTGKFDKGYFSTDPEIFSAAYRVKNENKFKNLKITQPTGSMFAIKERVVWKS